MLTFYPAAVQRSLECRLLWAVRRPAFLIFNNNVYVILNTSQSSSIYENLAIGDLCTDYAFFLSIASDCIVECALESWYIITPEAATAGKGFIYFRRFEAAAAGKGLRHCFLSR